MRKTIDDETGSTVSYEEVAFRRVSPPGDEKTLVTQQKPAPKPTPDVLYVLQHVSLGGKVIESM